MGAQPGAHGDVPPASSFVKPCKRGKLTKLVGRRWIFLPVWKERYCVLDGSKLYYYDSETSKGTNSSCGVVNLEHFDVCEEYENKAVQNAFVITSSNRGFFFGASHTFAADTLPEVCDWIATIRSKLNPAVQKRSSFIRKSFSKRTKSRSSLEDKTPDPTLDIPGKEPLESITKHRAKGPAGRRPPQRKSQMPKPVAASLRDANHTAASVAPTEEVLEEGEEVSQAEVDKRRPVSALLYQYSSSDDEDRVTPQAASQDDASQTKGDESTDDLSADTSTEVDGVHERLSHLREQLASHVDDETMKSLLQRLDHCEVELQTAVLTVHKVLNEASAVLEKTKQADQEERTPA